MFTVKYATFLTPCNIKSCEYLEFYLFRKSRRVCSFDIQICITPPNKSTFSSSRCLKRSAYHPKVYVHLN